MNIGDTIITRSGEKYRIDKFIKIDNEPAVSLKSLNGKNGCIKPEAYVNFFIGTGIYRLQNGKTRKTKKLRRRKAT